MSSGYILVEKSLALEGKVSLSGAKNAVLVIMASLLLTRGKSVLRNVPALSDVDEMITILRSLGAIIHFDAEYNILEVDTTHLVIENLDQEAVKKFRASLLIFGPLLAQFPEVKVAMPGGDAIGARPVDYHIKNFKKLGADVFQDQEFLHGFAHSMHASRLVLDYPSVGATENLLMALTLIEGESWIVNAALEPEVLDLIEVLQKMGSDIVICPPAMIRVRGVKKLQPVEHTVIVDRLETGSILAAAAITKGSVYIENGQPWQMDLFLMKLSEMGHSVTVDKDGKGIYFKSSKTPQAVSFKTAPYPGFPTDLQALMMAAQITASGSCNIIETVFENRFLHVPEMNKMGSSVEQISGHFARLHGVSVLQGTEVVATDIRAACALALLGLAADGQTKVLHGVHHWKRGYETLDQKLNSLGAQIRLIV